MAQCVAISKALAQVPMVGSGLRAAALSFGGVLQAILSGLLQGDPVIIAGVLAGSVIGGILLFWISKISRIATSIIAISGFFVLSLCAV